MHVIQAIRNHPVWAAISGFGFLTVLDLFGYIQTGSGLMADLLGPNWLSLLVTSPWFKVTGLAILIFGLWRIQRLSLAEDQSAREREEKRAEESHRRQESAQRAILQVPSDIVRAYCLNREIGDFEVVLRNLDSKANTAHADVSKWRDGFTLSHKPSMQRALPHSHLTTDLPTYQYLQINAKRPDLSHSEPVYEKIPVPANAGLNPHDRRFSPNAAHNTLFLATEDENVRRYRKWIADLNKALGQEKERLLVSQRALDGKLVAHGQ